MYDCAERWSQSARRLEELSAQILRSVRTVPWSGVDHERFLSSTEQVLTRFGTARARVEALSHDLVLHAKEQDAASAPETGGDAHAETLRRLFGKEGGTTAEDLDGFLTSGQVDSRAIEVDDIENFSPETDLVQGSIGNCWFLASLASVAARDPAMIEEHITLVEGETPEDDYWEVELWNGSEWVTHVVTQDEIVRNGVRDADGEITWMTIYERAAVEHMGGEYGDIERNFAGKGFDIVSGDSGSMSVNLDLDAIEKKLEDGQSVVTSTPPGIPLIGPTDDVVPGHVYVVDEIIRPADGSEPRIRLINPWGVSYDGKPAVLELTQSEYTRSFISHNSWKR